MTSSATTPQPEVESALSSMEIEIEGAPSFARDRIEQFDHPGTALMPDAATVEAIEAEFMLSVYRARRLYRRRLLGRAAPPPPPTVWTLRFAHWLAAGPGEQLGQASLHLGDRIRGHEKPVGRHSQAQVRS